MAAGPTVALLGYLCWPLLIIGGLAARPGLAGLLAVRAAAYPVIGPALVAFFVYRLIRQRSAMWLAMMANTTATAAFSFAAGQTWVVVLFYLASAAVPLAVGAQAARVRTARTMLAARDSERQRIERDIHDGVRSGWSPRPCCSNGPGTVRRARSWYAPASPSSTWPWANCGSWCTG